MRWLLLAALGIMGLTLPGNFDRLRLPFTPLWRQPDRHGREPAEPLLHYNGRWSNGPLWVEYLSERLGFAYNPSNYAHSGAQCDDTFRAGERFTTTNNVFQSLFVVWAGGNDFSRNTIHSGSTTPAGRRRSRTRWAKPW